jgi:hypothetical protein
MKLTAKQNMIIYAMQQGWELITGYDQKYVCCCSNSGQFNFSLTIFFNLLAKDLIEQQQHPTYDYVLTKLGKEVKTKPVDLSIKN